ncbi:MAG: response regulator transcription factor [Dehalococcoidales bacterium]|nr:response regulator transcription factor [Dehalococcoidales bacterium]
MSPKITRILVVDDDLEIIQLAKRMLGLAGYEVITAENGETALQKMEDEQLDLVLLDLMMPGLDGITVCRKIRTFSTIPIIMLTAKVSDEDKVKGLDAGADDYVTKPFSTQELLARVKAVLRRSQDTFLNTSYSRLVSGILEIDFTDRRITVAGKEVNLTPTEFNLLQELAQNNGKVLTHTWLLQRIWGSEYHDERRYLHVFINRLRNKLGLDNDGQQIIENISGVGYRFNIL